MNTKELEQICHASRRDILTYISYAESGHPGSALSIVDILANLYFNHINVDPKNPHMPTRDRFVLSKGHGDMALYSILSRKGFFHKDWLKTYRKFGSILQGHPEISTPGVDASSGSLGQGLSIGCGMALGAKIDELNYSTYVLMGDGELNEGQIWEAAIFASAKKLNNLIGIVDYNGLQHDGLCENILPMGDLSAKWSSFGWTVYSCNGHDHIELNNMFDKIKRDYSNSPKILIAQTIKGKGVTEYENKVSSHSVHGKIEDKILSEYNGEIKND